MGACEQVGAQRPVSQVQQSSALTFQAVQGNDRSGQNPGLVITTQADFPYPCELPVWNAKMSGLFLCGRCKTLAADLNVKGAAALFLQGPGK
tara:strand:- start:697 stop:972 length:276 start_codon:yes stop_codon:yes gene_type:complete